MVQIGMLAFGARIGYSDPRTISPKSAVRRLEDGSIEFAPGGIQVTTPSLDTEARFLNRLFTVFARLSSRYLFVCVPFARPSPRR